MKLSLKRLGSRRTSSRRGVLNAVDEAASSVVKELTATFKVFDKDGDGRISKCELGSVLRSLGDAMSDGELDELIVKVDGDGDGFIDLDEFIRFHTRTTTARDREESIAAVCGDEWDETTSFAFTLRAAFDVFDVDKNGFISAEELQTVMRSLGDKHTSLAECRHMINCVDKDGDHMVDFNEFQCLMSSTAFVC